MSFVTQQIVHDIIGNIYGSYATNAVSAVTVICVLYLNKTKYNSSFALRLFVWHCFGMELIGMTITFLSKIQFYIPFFSDSYKSSLNIVVYSIESCRVMYGIPVLMALHRLVTYLACTKPLFYKKYFTQNKLNVYYVLCDIICIILIIPYYFIFKNTMNYSKFFENSNTYYLFITTSQALLLCGHLALTALSLHALMAFKKQQQKTSAMNDFKAYFYFSWFHIISSFITLLDCLGSLYKMHFYNFSEDISMFFAWIYIINFVVVKFRIICYGVAILICLPNFRRSFKRVILRQENTKVIMLSSSTTNNTGAA